MLSGDGPQAHGLCISLGVSLYFAIPFLILCYWSLVYCCWVREFASPFAISERASSPARSERFLDWSSHFSTAAKMCSPSLEANCWSSLFLSNSLPFQFVKKRHNDNVKNVELYDCTVPVLNKLEFPLYPPGHYSSSSTSGNESVKIRTLSSESHGVGRFCIPRSELSVRLYVLVVAVSPLLL